VLWCVSVCCGELRCVAVCCIVLWCVAVFGAEACAMRQLQCDAV